MTFFFLWIGLIALALGIYSVVLWRRAKNRSRFQARLTIIFFLLVLVPSVPLTLFISMLLARSSEMLVQPGVEQALSQSLELIRRQLNERGQRFLSENSNLRSVSDTQLKDSDLSYVGELRWEKGQSEIIFYKTSDPLLQRTAADFEPEDISQITAGVKTGASISLQNLSLYESYKADGDSLVSFVGFRIPQDLGRAKDEIGWALKNYTSMILLRETFIDQGLVWTIAIAFLILLAVISIYAARTLSRGISEPIQKLSEGMRVLGAGELSHRVSVAAKDEIGFLVDSFNRMADELKTSRENLQRAERAAAWRDVARQVSHEIKNPLTPIQFSLFRLKSSLPPEYLQSKELKESFRIIDDEIASMRRIADEFSEFARMPHLELKPENIADILRHSARLFEGEAHSVTIKLMIEEDVPPLLLDRDQFRRAIHNLLKNAMEASAPGDSVEILLSKKKSDEQGAFIEIIDHGCGMDEETIRRALEPYFTTKENGSGLGLYIVNRIISEHGGKMQISSRPNAGTTVRILI
jgi:nitrogen fixation/metabolism regulation signal transduction histidine kinase